jgi:hypothetical protein
MTEEHSPAADLSQASREEILSALFANLVLQQANLAMMFLGRVPHPETGEAMLDPDSARMIIDQLEMLEFKTRGNLDKREAALLQQSLTTLRMAFVEAIELPEAAGAAAPSAPPAPSASAATAPPPASPPTATAAAAQPAPASSEEEPRRRFSKKY